METDITRTAHIQYEGDYCGVGSKVGSFSCECGSGGRCHLFQVNRHLGVDNCQTRTHSWIRVPECIETTKHLDNPIEPEETIWNRLMQES